MLCYFGFVTLKLAPQYSNTSSRAIFWHWSNLMYLVSTFELLIQPKVFY